MKSQNAKNTPDINHFSDYDIYLFKKGAHYRLFDKLGAHLYEIMDQKGKNIKGVHFSVWAPNAKSVSVTGDFNSWDINANPMGPRWDQSGIWEVFVPGVIKGSLYKFHIKSSQRNYKANKSDPFAFFCETPPKTASIVWDTEYSWNDANWMANRHLHNSLNSPFSVYELHIGSWKRIAEQNNRPLSYREMAEQLVLYLKETEFTHVEFMPVTEHPFYGSWGYQATGYFAPTSRYGTPQDLMYLIDCLHGNNIGVILDWVPSHFPNDMHALALFDGTELYEHKNPMKGFHPDWKSLIFNYGRSEVKEFLISSAVFWIEKYHFDGLRLDGVTSMLYLDYSRKKGKWIPNKFGGRENLEAIDFLKELNTAVYKNFPDVQTFAEESTAWPAVTKPVYLGGLGFGMKWNMGWMHDSLQYFSRKPIYRKLYLNELTHIFWYSFNENFILPLSHDEVVYGKKSLLEKMPGGKLRRFANLRLLLSYMYGFPGKKLLFMGAEIGQSKEWDHEGCLDWSLLEQNLNAGIKNLVRDLNKIYKSEPALFSTDFDSEKFEWIDYGDIQQSTLFFMRKSGMHNTGAEFDDAAGNKKNAGNSGLKKHTVNNTEINDNMTTCSKLNDCKKITRTIIVVACNFTPAPRHNYRIGVPYGGTWQEIFNSDAEVYGGSGQGNFGKVYAKKIPAHSKPYSVSITLPPLAVVYLKKRLTLDRKD